MDALKDNELGDRAQKVLAYARKEFALRAPLNVDLGRLPQVEIVDSALKALGRVPEMRAGKGQLVIDQGGTFQPIAENQLGVLLGEILRPVRDGKPVQVPRWLPKAILARKQWPEILLVESEEKLAKRKSEQLVAKATLMEVLADAMNARGRGVTGQELLDQDPSKVGDALTRLERPADAKALGYVLRGMQKDIGSRVATDGKDRGNTKWKLLL